MIPLNYHHLYYFWTVAKAGSITAARERLYLAQPTLSLQLAQLERSCGGRLLERSRQGVALTPLGQQVFEHCERIFSEGEVLAAFLKAGTAQPVVRVGVEAAVPREAVLELLERARSLAPGVRVGLFSGGGLIPRFRRRSLDLILTLRDPAGELGPGYRVRRAGELPLAFVAHKDLARRGEPLKSALARLPVLLRPSGHPVREQTDAFLARLGVAVRVEGELDDVELLKRLVLGRRGAAAIEQVAVADELSSGRLVRLHAKPLGIVDRLWLAGPASPAGLPETRGLLADLLERFRVD